jgi:hypothetical protein
MPDIDEMKKAMDTLKTGGCEIDTKVDPAGKIVFVVYVPIDKLGG